MNGANPKARAWLATPEGDAFLNARERLEEALEREQQANSPEAIAAAQQAAMVALTDLVGSVGGSDLLHRRMLAEFDGDPGLDGRFYHDRIERAVMDDTPKGRIALRHAVARFVYDCAGIIGAPLANHLTGHLMETASGRIGLMDAEALQGVDPETGAAFELQRSVIGQCGYTVGQEVTKARVPPEIWRRAAHVYNALAVELRAKGEKVAPVTAATIRDCCTRRGGGHDRFVEMRANGCRDRADGKTDPARRLGRSRRK